MLGYKKDCWELGGWLHTGKGVGSLGEWLDTGKFVGS